MRFRSVGLVVWVLWCGCGGSFRKQVPTSDGSIDSGSVVADGGSDASASLDSGADAALVPVCGDRAITAPEQCDDGNLLSNDGCSASCRHETPASCGNGTVDLALFEQCDDGNVVSNDGCGASCLIEAAASCGDGSLNLNAGEECDDANVLPGDGCGPACQLEAVGAFCGDNVLDPNEACDDGNTLNGDGCSATCNLHGTSSVFVGAQGMYGTTDGIGGAARIGDAQAGSMPVTYSATGTLTADAQYLWYAQGANGRLRRIDVASAQVTTVATIAVAEGVATDGTSTVWVAGGQRIQAITRGAPYTVTDVHGPGTACANAACWADGAPGTATFGDVRGLTWYGGYLWIVDTMAAVVRRMDPTTHVVTTVAGSPFQYNVAPANVPIDGIGAAARFTSPRYIVSDGTGILYISDTNGASIRTLDARTFAVGTYAGNGTSSIVDGLGGAAGPARVGRPRGITSDGTSVYWVEFNQNVIRQGVTASLGVSTLSGTPSVTGSYVEGTGTTAGWSSPFSIAYHFPTRSLFVLDSGNFLIRRIQ